MTDIYEQIGEKIRGLRGKLSQEALASQLNIAANKLSRWETGAYRPSAEDLDNLARYFKVSINFFFPHQQEEIRQKEEERISALTSATSGLGKQEFDEIIRYAEFCKIRSTIATPKVRKKKK